MPGGAGSPAGSSPRPNRPPGVPCLVAEARADAAALLAALGWQEAGRLEGGALGAGDSPLDTVWLSHRG